MAAMPFIICLALILLPAATAGAQTAPDASVGLTAIVGAAYDRETGEGSPARLITGLEMTYGPFGFRALADCGLPWEPSVRLDAEAAALDLSWLRVSAGLGLSYRAYAAFAQESGFRFGAQIELGPRFLSFSSAVGLAYLSTTYAAVGGPFTDWNPGARVGVVFRPVGPAQFELGITSDSPLSLWARTAFELRGSWELPSGVRFAGELALQYSDFFTLTSYIDGFRASLTCFLPLTGRGP